MKALPEGLDQQSPYSHGLDDFNTVMTRGNFRQKECLLMMLSQMARLTPCSNIEEMARSIAHYFVEVQSGRIK